MFCAPENALRSMESTMHATTTPGFSHASVERLCDYELPDPPARASAAMPLLSDVHDPEKLALTWWLWMDEMGKSMWRHCDAWREHHLGTTAKGPADRG
jgi:hypothetical protein